MKNMVESFKLSRSSKPSSSSIIRMKCINKDIWAMKIFYRVLWFRKLISEWIANRNSVLLIIVNITAEGDERPAVRGIIKNEHNIKFTLFWQA